MSWGEAPGCCDGTMVAPVAWRSLAQPQPAFVELGRVSRNSKHGGALAGL